MGDRKVAQKYIPPDFDPKLIKRGTKLSAKDGTVPVRMMLPFSVQCSTCGTFLYRGTKFNSKKEPMGGPDGRYLGIQRFRFYIKCVMCKRTISFLTDPKNADYEMETGGTRNYEVYKDKAKTEEESAQEKEEDEKEDPMRALENRVLDSQREMADMDNLEAIQAMNRNHLKLMSKLELEDGWDADTKAVLAALDKKDQSRNKDSHLNENGLTAEDEELVKTIEFGQKQKHLGSGEGLATVRLSEEDERREEERRQQNVEMIRQRQLELEKKTAAAKAKVPVIKVKRKVKQQLKKEKKESPKKADLKEAGVGGGLAGLFGAYGSDSDSD